MLYALGLSREEIIETFYSLDLYTYDKASKLWSTKFIPEIYKRPIKITFDLIEFNLN